MSQRLVKLLGIVTNPATKLSIIDRFAAWFIRRGRMPRGPSRVKQFSICIEAEAFSGLGESQACILDGNRI